MHHPDPHTTPENLAELVDFLSSPLVSSLLELHPNDLGTSSFRPPTEWSEWWDWAGGDDAENRTDPWLLLLRYYDTLRATQEGVEEPPPDAVEGIPPTLRSLIEGATRLALPREAGRVIFPHIDQRSGPSAPRVFERRDATEKGVSLAGMSPKKAHEVVQMSDFVSVLSQSDAELRSLRHVVDVGAGQAYLSRMLRDKLELDVLALDFSDVQTQGAAKRDTSKPKRKAPPNGPASLPLDTHPTDVGASERPKGDGEPSEPRRGSLTYVTAKIDSNTLRESTDAWTERERSAETSYTRHGDGSLDAGPTPVLFVALHACGSLTPDILRTFAAAAQSRAATWTPRAAVIVGCCYNMLRPEDFPLSQKLKEMEGPDLALTAGHLQLAAQVPSQWTRTEETLRDARLAIRKVVWRALIQDALDGERRQSAGETGTMGDPSESGDRRSGPKRLGRLNDAAYADWETFARRVQTKLVLPEGRLVRADRALERRIEVFHVLRCIVGPVVESLLLLDRALWTQEALQGTGFSVELVNLFDQASGSGRNVAIVIRPKVVDNSHPHE